MEKSYSKSEVQTLSLDMHAKLFLDRQALLNLPDVSEVGTLARYAGHEEIDIGGPVGDEAVISHHYITTPTADVPVRIYTPKRLGPYRGLVYFHGGGWVFGHIDRYDSQLVELSDKTNSIILSVNYQKSPEHKFPIPHDDCFAALKWMIEKAESLNINQDKIGVGGDSAGGNLAAGVALRARDENLLLAYQLLIYPATDLDFDTESYLSNSENFGLRRRGMMWFWDQYLSESDKKNGYAVPAAATDHALLAPSIIITAEYDVLRDDGLRYATILKSASNDVIHKDFAGQIHGFFSLAKYIPESYVLREWIVDKINGLFN
jgi:acetyl esterase